MQPQKTYARMLAIAGSDSGGCAGIQADVKAASACGCFAATAITALTAQNTVGVRAVHIPPVEMICGQIRAVLDDIGADAVKLGMLPTVQIVDAVADLLQGYGVGNIVLDPVMVATSGNELIDRTAADAIVARLLSVARLVTPNIPEAEYITGEKISSQDDFTPVAERFARLGVRNLLLKAGHLQGQATLTDYLFTQMQSDRPTVHTFEYDFIDTPNTHGTGCTLSSSIAAYLALGYGLVEAVTLAEEYLHKAILCGADYTLGRGHGPLHHFYKFWE